jgi:hypothetical protein
VAGVDGKAVGDRDGRDHGVVYAPGACGRLVAATRRRAQTHAPR